MKKFVLLAIAVCTMGFAASAAEYSIDDSEIDALVENAVEVSVFETSQGESLNFAGAGEISSFSSNRSPVAAFVLDFFLGGFGVHRHYLGTRPGMWAIYTFTFGGIFGIVPFVDWVMLLVGIIDDDITRYCDNPDFLMWA